MYCAAGNIKNNTIFIFLTYKRGQCRENSLFIDFPRIYWFVSLNQLKDIVLCVVYTLWTVYLCVHVKLGG